MKVVVRAVLLLMTLPALVYAGDGRLLATSGLTQV